MRSDLVLDCRGWLTPTKNISLKPSPNFDDRPCNLDPYLLVIHNISLPPGQFGGPYISDFFQNKLDTSLHAWFENIAELKVSAHFLIDRNGRITQFVSTNKRAWHAGVSSFNDKNHCNDFSIGIELEGTDNIPYTHMQYSVLAALTHAIRQKHNLTAVQGHEHIAPQRKTDPGPAFDWPRYITDAKLWELNCP